MATASASDVSRAEYLERMRSVRERGGDVFEELLVGIPERRSILLHTHMGNAIDNEIAVHPVPQHAIDKFNRIARQHPNWRHRKAPTGIYNCFGHVWASRRTAVYDKFDEVVLRVRADDGYRTINRENENPSVGDIASYWASLDPYKDCAHLGLVACVLDRKGGLPPEVWILSKWDDTAGEVMHEANDHCFRNVKLEYWTDRPFGPSGAILR